MDMWASPKAHAVGHHVDLAVMASGEGGAAFGRCADAGNTWQEGKDMPDAVDMHNPLVVAVPHLTPAEALAGTHAGLAPAHLVRASGG